MDRSLLSDTSIAEASRDFVCIRLATYESAEEAAYMKKLYRGRVENIANTTFAFIDHTGEKLLSRASRGANQQFRRPSSMVDAMDAWIENEYSTAKSQRYKNAKLPLMANFEIGLNVAACDYLLIIALVDVEELKEDGMEQQLLKTAWSDEFAGQFIYAKAKPSQLKSVSGKKRQSGVFVVEPDPFGLSGRLLDSTPSGFDTQELQSRLRKHLAEYRPAPKDSRSHIQMGINFGFDWKSKIPVTDSQANRAKERARGSGS